MNTILQPKTKPYNLEAIQAGATPITRDGRLATLKDVSTMYGSPVGKFEAPGRHGVGTTTWYVGANGHDLDSMGSDLDVFILDEDEPQHFEIKSTEADRADSLAMAVVAFALYDSVELGPHQLSADDSEYYRNEAFDEALKPFIELYEQGYRSYMCYEGSEEAKIIQNHPAFNLGCNFLLLVRGVSSIAIGSMGIKWTRNVWQHGFVSKDVAPKNDADRQNYVCTFIPKYEATGVSKTLGARFMTGTRGMGIARDSADGMAIRALPQFDADRMVLTLGPGAEMKIVWTNGTNIPNLISKLQKLCRTTTMKPALSRLRPTKSPPSRRSLRSWHLMGMDLTRSHNRVILRHEHEPHHVVTIPEIRETQAELYGPGGMADQRIGVVTSLLALNEVRLQIKEHKLTGYYLIWRNPALKQQTTRIDIKDNGVLSDWPNGFFDLIDIQLDKLTSWT